MNQTTKIILAIILTIVIVGGSVYYYLNQANQIEIDNLEAQIDQLGQEQKEEKVSEYEAAKIYCEGRAKSNAEVDNIVFVENDDGYFVECGISAGVGGFTSIGKKIDDSWQKVWEGNGELLESIVRKYDLPHSIHKGMAISD